MSRQEFWSKTRSEEEEYIRGAGRDITLTKGKLREPFRRRFLIMMHSAGSIQNCVVRVEFLVQFIQATCMTATVEQTQSELVRLIRLVVEGEEIVITQAGRPVAKLTGIAQPSATLDRRPWLDSLRQLRERTSTGKAGKSSDEILTQDRTGRD